MCILMSNLKSQSHGLGGRNALSVLFQNQPNLTALPGLSAHSQEWLTEGYSLGPHAEAAWDMSTI